MPERSFCTLHFDGCILCPQDSQHLYNRNGNPAEIHQDQNAETLEVSPASMSKCTAADGHRDLDQIIADIRSPKHLDEHKNSKAKEDLPGLGEYYCIECAKYFEAQNSYDSHLKGKPHKRR